MKKAAKLSSAEKQDLLATLERLSQAEVGAGKRKVVPFGRRAGDEKLRAEVEQVAEKLRLPAAFFEYFEFESN